MPDETQCCTSKMISDGVLTRLSGQPPSVRDRSLIIGLAIERPDMIWSVGLPTLTVTLKRYAEREERKENALDARPTRRPLVREIAIQEENAPRNGVERLRL